MYRLYSLQSILDTNLYAFINVSGGTRRTRFCIQAFGFLAFVSII